MKTVYISGPMKGYPNSNFPAFDEAATRAREAGWHVLNPADFDREVGFDGSDPSIPFDMDKAIDRDIAAIRSLKPDNGDAIAMLPGWEKSKGALGELGLAMWMRLTVLDAQTLLPIADVAPKIGEDRHETILEEAARLTSVDRNKDYGTPLDNHSATADYWSLWIKRKYSIDVGLSAEDVCWMNVLQKVSREANSPKRDNKTDVAGYVRNVEMVEDERAKRENGTGLPYTWISR